MKGSKTDFIFITTLVSILLFSCSDCGYRKSQVIHGLKNHQSIIGFVRTCGATTSDAVNIMFVKPGMNLGNEKTDIFSAELSWDFYLEKVSVDTVRIIYCATDERITRQESEVYGIHFIYEKNCKYFDENK